MRQLMKQRLTRYVTDQKIRRLILWNRYVQDKCKDDKDKRLFGVWQIWTNKLQISRQLMSLLHTFDNGFGSYVLQFYKVG